VTAVIGAESDPDDVTHDALLRGRVQLIQPARGFRSSLDPVLLAGFVSPPYGRFVDIGCGAGPVSFLLLARDPGASGVGVEIQPRLARLATLGAQANGYRERLEVHAADVRTVGDLGGGFDLVVTNPPFRPLGTGVLPPDEERSIANHELTLRLGEWLDAGTRMLGPAGRLAAIFPTERWPELAAGLTARGLSPARLRPVAARPQVAPRRLLVEARRGPRGAVAMAPPLVVHDGAGFSEEMRRLLGEG
jgi:tRNA1Val (adenine37-N6)-methyltransferase